MSMTCDTKSATVLLFTLSRKSGWVSRSAVGTASSSEPACPKYVVRKVLRAVLLVMGRERLAKAARTWSRGRMVGL